MLEDNDIGVVKMLSSCGLLKTCNCEMKRKRKKVKLADKTDLKKIYEKYATLDVEGEKCMSDVDFFVKFLCWLPENGHNKRTLEMFRNSFENKSYLTLEEFEQFEEQASSLDFHYRLSFHIFSKGSSEGLSYKDFLRTLENTNLKCDIKADFVQFYFGKDCSKLVQLAEFPQFLKDLSAESAKTAFKACDTENSGYISAENFCNIILCINQALPEPVKESIQEMTCNCKMLQLGGLESGYDVHRVSFGHFSAFNNILKNIDTIKIVYLSICGGNKKVEVSKEDFMSQSQIMTSLTPLEVDILFKLCSLFHEKGLSGPWRGSLPVDWRVVEDVEIADHQCQITLSDLEVISPTATARSDEVEEKDSLVNVQQLTSNQYQVIQLLESFYRFTLGSVAGAVGATTVYPVDLVKTRMQNQRTSSYLSETLYKNSWDCFRKVLNHEGFLGLYRGLLPQLVGVSPEKAIKLTMNDLVRGNLKDEVTGNLPIWGEIIAGGCAGASQVMFTNPLEIVKIRLQVAGEISSGAKVSALKVVKDLGLAGLYKGSAACFLRDIPFSGIFFPAYAHLKDYFADSSGQNSPLSLLTAGGLAGIPAAFLVTPADVIKTRLQVKARHNQTSYLGVRDAASKIYGEEGIRAFWKGSVARMCRSSPQFGVTLLAYELLQKVFYVDFSKPGRQDSISHGCKPHADHIGGFRVASSFLPDMEKKLGLVFHKHDR